jgi:glycosyltransferase involved in cell wall biosynthesis
VNENKKMKISIVTPCLNSENGIAETIESVLKQTAILSGRAELEYLVCDGISTDSTVTLARSYGDPRLQIISEHDSGMYDALAKGLSRVTGDIVAYINAGDYYHKCAFDIALDMAEKGIEWFTGFQIIYTENSYVVDVTCPFIYRRAFIMKGMYDGICLPFIQQESVFWSKRLNNAIDFAKLKTFKLAGDYFLWHTFAHLSNLHIAAGYVGGFKVEQDQLSSNKDGYRSEIRNIIGNNSPPTMLDWVIRYIDRKIWLLPAKVKKRFNPRGIALYDWKLNQWN